MNARAWIRHKLARLWAQLTFQYGMAVGACGLAVWMHYQYRLGGSWVFLTFPVIGLILLALNVLMIVNQFATSLPKWDPVRRLLAKLELSASVLVRCFVYGSLLWYANGILDSKPPQYRSAVIDSEGWKRTAGFQAPYSWVTLRYRDDPDHPTKVLITWGEQRKLWGAQPVSVTLKNGIFGVQTVTAIEQDWGWYGNEILKLAPNATMIRQLKIYFDLSHNRWADGIETAKQSIELNPSDWMTAMVAGELLVQAARYNDSLPFFEHGVKQHPIYTNMQEYGHALNWSGQSPRAAEIIKASIPLDPNNWEAYYHLGYIYGDMAQYEEAIMYFEESLKRRPGSSEINSMIAKHRQDIASRDNLKPNKVKKVSSPNQG